MRVKELFLLESFAEVSVHDIGIADLVKQADESLPYPAAQAITNFVGGTHDARKIGQKFGIMHSRMLEDAFSHNPSQQGLQIKQQLEQAFEPVKQYLQNKFGNTITLHRAQRPVKDQPMRTTLSWTVNPQIAAGFGGIDPYELKLKPISDLTIAKALHTYHTTGQLKFGRTTYKRTSTPTSEGFGQGKDEYYYEIWDDDELITDGDDIEKELKDRQEYIQSLIDKRELKKQRIITAVIPIDDIIWITDRFGQSEFILKNKPGSPGYISNQFKVLSVPR